MHYFDGKDDPVGINPINFDFRLTRDPKIKSSDFQMFLFGELTSNNTDCKIPQDNSHNFQGRDDYMEIIVTRRSINCALQAFENSGLN